MPDQVDFSAYFHSPELLADKFREFYFHDQPTVYPIDPFQVLNTLGIPFSFRNFNKLEGIYLAAADDNEIPVIGINQNRPITRQRFTAAHELCHHIKDRGLKRVCPIDGRSKDRIEKFAESFAAAFLMPLPELQRQVAFITVMDDMSMCDFIDEAVKIHHRITVIHPFPEGNGRTSRAFLNWMFILKGIPPVYLKADRKDEYIEALHIADTTGDYTKLREVFYKAVLSSFIELSDFPGF